MPRPTPTHFLCAASGFILAAVCAVSMGQQQPVNILDHRQPQIEVGPHPRDFVQIREGTPYTVPAGHVFVLTALGSSTALGVGVGDSGIVSFVVDGQAEASSYATITANYAPLSIGSVPRGCSVPQGSTIAVTAAPPATGARAYGYIAKVGSPDAGTGTVARVQYAPHPKDMVQVAQGTPYTVPHGKLFVLTGFGGTNQEGGFEYALMVDGQVELKGQGPSANVITSVRPMPVGFTVRAGSVIDVVQTYGSISSPARAWGFLADQ